MQRAVTFLLLAVISLLAPVESFAARSAPARQQSAAGTLSGKAVSANGENLPGHRVRIRSSSTGNVVAEAVTDSAGGFSAAGLPPGSYVVEVLGADGAVIGLSPAVAVTAGSTATVTVTSTAAAGAAAGATAGGVSLFGLGTAATIGIVGAATVGAIVGIRAATRDASPSGQ
jgi:hypothetical protein